MKIYENYIDGKFTPAKHGGLIPVLNPATEEIISEVPDSTKEDRSAFDQVQGYHAGWKRSGIGGEDGKHGVYEYLNTHVVTINYA
jgi:acyl-CoA reductase-like NAD-dependent aldehyde dehydrogenase